MRKLEFCNKQLCQLIQTIFFNLKFK
jgi:hypothetical protein